MKVKKAKLNQFAEALQYLHLTYNVKADQARHCMLKDGKAVSFNMIVAAGTTIEEDLHACPDLSLMFEALQHCGEEYIITQIAANKLQVRSGEFQAYVPCVTSESLVWPVPDAPIAPLDDRLTEALIKLAPLLDVKAESVLEQSIQLNAGSAVATNRKVVLEAWHGFDLPDGLLLPKAIVVALKRAKKRLKEFGCSEHTATFYFDDGTWLRTQLFDAKWPPGVKAMLNAVIPNCRPVPPLLFEAYRQVAPFSASSCVYVKDGLISSHPFDAVEEGGKLRLPIGSDHAERCYPIENLDYASQFAELWDEYARDNGTYFQGNGVRGLITHHGISNDAANTI